MQDHHSSRTIADRLPETEPLEAVLREAAGTRLWRNRHFNIFWAGQTLSVFGDAFATIAIPLLVLQATGSVAMMGLVTAVFGIAQVLTGLFAGWLADRLDRRLLMVFCDVSRTLLYCAIPLGWWLMGPQLWLIFAVVATGSALGMIFQVTYITAVANLVEPDQLNEANSRLQATLALSFILGPVLAGLVSSSFGPSSAIVVDAVSFAVSACSLLLIRLRPIARVSPLDLLRAETPAQAALPREMQKRGNLGQEFLAGLRFLWEQPVLRSLTFLLFFAGLLTSGALDIFIFHLKRDLGQNDSTVGLVFGLASIGGLIAGVVAPRVRRRLGFAVCWIGGMVGQFAALALIGLSLNLWSIGLLAVVFTFTSTLTGICSISLRQQITPDYLLGRVTSAFWTLTSAPAPLGAALLTALAGQVGAAVVLCAVGIAGTLVALLSIFTPVRRQGRD